MAWSGENEHGNPERGYTLIGTHFDWHTTILPRRGDGDMNFVHGTAVRCPQSPRHPQYYTLHDLFHDTRILERLDTATLFLVCAIDVSLPVSRLVERV